ncbi:beta-ketoacyl synthase N-terminal-like domain-containing protein [Planctomycetota bacterium]|nr:beta-ketoacyl synthase N-terminal-like domain-containing protein [Planctomycetota bacterium]
MALKVCGFGCVSALGDGPDAFKRGLIAGTSTCALHEFARLDGSVFSAPAFKAVKPDPNGLIEPRKLRRMFRLARMVAVSARQALFMAKIDLTKIDPGRVGVVIGTEFGALEVTQKFIESWLANGDRAASPLQFMNSVHGILASVVALDINATGVNLTVNQSELSFEVALLHASNMLTSGRADLILVGGGDELTPLTAELGTRLHLIKSGTNATFDPQARDTSTVAGEGAAVFAVMRDDSEFAGMAQVDSIWQGSTSPAALDDADLHTNNRDGRSRTAALHENAAINHFGYWGAFPSAGALQFAANILMVQEARVFPPAPNRAPDISPRSIRHNAASAKGSFAGYVLHSTT